MLTYEEEQFIDHMADAANMVSSIIGDGPTRSEDMAEAVLHIHALQRMVAAQSAARLYPGRYRLLGEVVG